MMTLDQWDALLAYIKAETGVAAAVGRGLSGSILEHLLTQRDDKLAAAKFALVVDGKGTDA